MKILNPRVHGYLDYAAVLLLALAPTLFGFSGTPAALCYVVAVMQLGMSLMTAYPLSIAKIIPFTIHGGIELATAIALAASPWIFGFNDLAAARNFFLVSGIGLLGVWAVTNYKAADYDYAKGVARTGSYGRTSYHSRPSFT